MHFQCLELNISHPPGCTVISRGNQPMFAVTSSPAGLVGSHKIMSLTVTVAVTLRVLRFRRCGWHCQSAVEPSETVEVSSVDTLIGPPAPLLVLSAVQSHSESGTVRQILTTVKRTYYRW